MSLTLCCKVSTLRKSNFLKHMKRANKSVGNPEEKYFTGYVLKNPSLRSVETLVDYMEISRTQSRCQIQNSPQGCYRSIKSSKLNTASGFRIFLQAVCGSSNIVTDVYLNPKKQF